MEINLDSSNEQTSKFPLHAVAGHKTESRFHFRQVQADILFAVSVPTVAQPTTSPSNAYNGRGVIPQVTHASSWTGVEPSNAHALFYVQTGLKLQNSTFYPHSTFMCFAWTSTVVNETQCVYCAVRAGSLREMQVTLLLEGTSRLRKNFKFYSGSKRNIAVSVQHRQHTAQDTGSKRNIAVSVQHRQHTAQDTGSKRNTAVSVQHRQHTAQDTSRTSQSPRLQTPADSL